MSIVADAVLNELQAALAISKNFQGAIKLAKTSAKSAFYTKKLKKNNKKVANLLIGLDNIEKAQYNTENNEK